MTRLCKYCSMHRASTSLVSVGSQSLVKMCISQHTPSFLRRHTVPIPTKLLNIRRETTRHNRSTPEIAPGSRVGEGASDCTAPSKLSQPLAFSRTIFTFLNTRSESLTLIVVATTSLTCLQFSVICLPLKSCLLPSMTCLIGSHHNTGFSGIHLCGTSTSMSTTFFFFTPFEAVTFTDFTLFSVDSSQSKPSLNSMSLPSVLWLTWLIPGSAAGWHTGTLAFSAVPCAFARVTPSTAVHRAGFFSKFDHLHTLFLDFLSKLPEKSYRLVLLLALLVVATLFFLMHRKKSRANRDK